MKRYATLSALDNIYWGALAAKGPQAVLEAAESLESFADLMALSAEQNDFPRLANIRNLAGAWKRAAEHDLEIRSEEGQ